MTLCMISTPVIPFLSKSTLLHLSLGFLLIDILQESFWSFSLLPYFNFLYRL